MNQDYTILSNSHAILLPHLDRVVNVFYHKLLNQHPELNVLIVEDNSNTNKNTIIDILEMIVKLLGEERKPEAKRFFVRLGLKHSKLDLNERHFGAFAQNLLSALRHVMRKSWSSEFDRAWRLAINDACVIMIKSINDINEEKEFSCINLEEFLKSS